MASPLTMISDRGSGRNVLLYDGDGNPITSIDNAIRVVSQEYLQAIAEGYVAGHLPFYKRGLLPAAGTSEVTAWNPGTQYVWPVTGQQMRIVSTDVNDTALGTGANTMHLVYLDSNYVQHDEHISLNGTTPVLTVSTNIFRVNSFHVETAGTGGKTAGTVSIQNTAGTINYSQLGVGQTVCRCSVYTVPAGYSLFVSDVTFSVAYTTSGKSERMMIHASQAPNGEVSVSGGIFWPYSEIMLVDNVFVSSSSTALKFKEKVDLKTSVIGETNAVCTSELRGWLELN